MCQITPFMFHRKRKMTCWWTDNDIFGDLCFQDILIQWHLWYTEDLCCKSVRGIWSNNPAFVRSVPSEPSDGALQKEYFLKALCLVKSSQIWALQQTASVQNASYFLPIICGQFWIRKRSTHGASQTGWTPSLCLRSSLISLFRNRIKAKGGASESVRINVNSLVDCPYQYAIAMHTAALQHLPFQALLLQEINILAQEGQSCLQMK